MPATLGRAGWGARGTAAAAEAEDVGADGAAAGAAGFWPQAAVRASARTRTVRRMDEVLLLSSPNLDRRTKKGRPGRAAFGFRAADHRGSGLDEGRNGQSPLFLGQENRRRQDELAAVRRGEPELALEKARETRLLAAEPRACLGADREAAIRVRRRTYREQP